MFELNSYKYCSIIIYKSTSIFLHAQTALAWKSHWNCTEIFVTTFQYEYPKKETDQYKHQEIL